MIDSLDRVFSASISGAYRVVKLVSNYPSRSLIDVSEVVALDD